MTPGRFPLKTIQVPALAPLHVVTAAPFQQPTTVPRRRIWRRIRAWSGFPAALSAVTTKRHGSPTTGAAVLVVNVAVTVGAAAADDARAKTKTAGPASRIDPILGTRSGSALQSSPGTRQKHERNEPRDRRHPEREQPVDGDADQRRSE